MFRFKILIFIVALLSVTLLAGGSVSMDSLLKEREQEHDEYFQYRSTMEERTWLNLVDLDKKANSLIETGQLVIESLLFQLEQEKKHFAESTEILKLEKVLLERDNELIEQELNKKTMLQRNFLILILLITFLAIISFVFLASVTRKYKSTKLELERLYSGQENSPTNGSSVKENAIIHQKLSIMKENNDNLSKELDQLANEKSAAVEALKKEIRDRKKMQQEIKSLIEQVRRQ